MRFDAFIFPVFFLIVLAAYWSGRTVRARNLVVLAASYVFYGWWDVRFLALIALSTAVDFWIGRALGASEDLRRRRALLWTSLSVNLGLLGTFKYFDFFATSAAEALGRLGLEANPPLLEIILPVGISFYTFQTLGYAIDVYRRDVRPERDWVAFACYVAFFPQLVAGPIERASRLLPQFHQLHKVDVAMWRSGATLIIYGMVKKVAVADNVAPMVDYVFGLDGAAQTGPLVLAGSVGFAIQIYADFSAYSDIARGAARLMGFELCVNFDKPYVSATPSEFWRRWHISLSQWLRDYLYISLGGNRGGTWFTYRNLMLTMVLGGLWHGAAWNYVLWGVWHGAILCVYRALKIDARLAAASNAARLAGIAFFWAPTLYGWMLFRATSAGQVVDMSAALLRGWTAPSAAGPILLVTLLYALPILVHHVLARGLRGEKWQPRQTWAWRAVIVGLALYGLIAARASETAFIYFQF